MPQLPLAVCGWLQQYDTRTSLKVYLRIEIYVMYGLAAGLRIRIRKGSVFI
jgi:hypothetical protein